MPRVQASVRVVEFLDGGLTHPAVFTVQCVSYLISATERHIRIHQALEGIIWAWGSRMPELKIKMINPVFYQILPPEEFDLFQPTKWIKSIGPLEQFHSASGLSKRDDESQVNMLLYSMGSKKWWYIGDIRPHNRWFKETLSTKRQV